jgi:hypothetical protein
VFFPDVGDANALSRPDMPSALVGCAKDLQDPKAWIDAVFAYWGNDASGFTPMGRRGVDVFREVFARSLCGAADRRSWPTRRRVFSSQFDSGASTFCSTAGGRRDQGRERRSCLKSRRLASEGFEHR